MSAQTVAVHIHKGDEPRGYIESNEFAKNGKPYAVLHLNSFGSVQLFVPHNARGYLRALISQLELVEAGLAVETQDTARS